jgi:hypothetical protein
MSANYDRAMTERLLHKDGGLMHEWMTCDSPEFDIPPEKIMERLAQENAALAAQLASCAAELARVERERQQFERSHRILTWLHTGSFEHRPGWQWGVAEIHFDEHGKLLDALWGFSDSSDVEQAMANEAALAAKGTK